MGKRHIYIITNPQNAEDRLLVKRETEWRLYDLIVISALAPFETLVGEAGLVLPPALQKALKSVLQQEGIRVFSVEVSQFFNLLQQNLEI